MRTGNLPADLTSLVGRRAESAAVRRSLSASRLVTLTGAGGVGKSRLALHVARRLEKSFPHGVWLVRLAELTDPDLLALTVMSTLTDVVPAKAGIPELTAHLRDRRLLLVLDNCEHLAEACAKLATDLLRNCPNLRVLATSREPLRVEGETLFPTPPLSLPEPGQPVSEGALTRYDAVRLFVDRAAAVTPGFTLTAESAHAVLTLCRRLDGLPLAIELAAARTRVLPVGDLVTWQDDRFRNLTGDSRTALPRHRTLRAAVDHSYELCSEPARVLWARMSVFAGGADLDTVQAVCAGGGLPRGEVWRTLSELVEKSIVVFDGTRYHLLETIRHYGRDRLREQGAEHATRMAHRDHVVALAAEVEAAWFGPDQPAVLARVRADLANVRAALEFCLVEPGATAAGLRVASDLWNFWLGCGLQSEGRLWMERLLAADPEPAPVRPRALWVAAYLAVADGDVDRSSALVDECLELASRLGDRASAAHVLSARGVCLLVQDRLEDAVVHLADAVRRERAVPGFNPYLAPALLNLAAALCHPGGLDEAQALLAEAREFCTTHGDQLSLSWSLVFSGLAEFVAGRVPRAVALLTDGLARKHTLGDLLGMNIAVEVMAWAALTGGDAERAARLMGVSQMLAEPLGAHLSAWPRLLEAHEQHARQARELLGRRAFDEALAAGRRMGKDDGVAYALGERDAAGRTAADLLPLTPRERHIAELVATGRTNREIAAELVVALRTVDTHVQNILRKLDLTSRTQIAALIASGPGTP